MDTHEVLVAARGVQERRGYAWGNGVVGREGSCCPSCSIAAVLGEGHFDDAAVLSSEAESVLAGQFGGDDRKQLGGALSSAVKCAEVVRGEPFTLAEILERFDWAIAATSPSPADPFPRGLEAEGPKALSPEAVSRA